MDISKKDWKLFREKLSGWQENYMEKMASVDSPWMMLQMRNIFRTMIIYIISQ